MSPTAPTVLLLDVMDTLVQNPFRHLPGHFGMTMPELLAAKDPRAWVDFELGRIDEATMLTRNKARRRTPPRGLPQGRRFGHRGMQGGRPPCRQKLTRFFRDRRPVDGDAVRALYTRHYDWIDGVQPLLEALAEQGVPMYALSNYPEWFRIIERKLRVSRYLGWRFVSCLTGVRKPRAEAYLGPLAALGVSAPQCLFVDDRRDNCQAARECGMNAVEFRSASQLAEALAEHGVQRGI